MQLEINKISVSDHWDSTFTYWKTLYPFMRSNTNLYTQSTKFNLMENLAVSPGGPWLAGGGARKMFFTQPIDTDLDLFFKDNLQYTMYEANLRYLARENRGVIFCGRSSYASNFVISGVKIQLINFEFYESIEKLFDAFDFTICHFAFDSEYFYFTQEAIEDEENKQLKTFKLKNPERCMRRIIKFAKQGYNFEKLNIKDFFKKVKLLEHEEIEEKPYDHGITWRGDLRDDIIEEICRKIGVFPKEIDFCSSSYQTDIMITFLSVEDKNLFKLTLSLEHPEIKEKKYESK